MKLFGSSFILALAAASPTVKRTCSPSIVEAPIIGGNTYPGYVQPSVNRPGTVGGDPATWGPGNQPSIVEAPIIGGNTYPGYVQPNVNRPAIVGGNPATWGPGNQPRPQRDIVGGDRRTWGPVQ